MDVDVRMGDLLEAYPSAALTLFARYGVGSRDKAGFHPDQTLREVLARHLMFEPEQVLQQVQTTDRSQGRWRQHPQRFAELVGQRVDCRSQAEFERFSLPGARLLDRELAQQARAQPDEAWLFFDSDGSMAGAAALHFEQLGCRNLAVLEGGLQAWSTQVDPTFPLLRGGYHPWLGGPPLVQADPRQVRFAVSEGVGPGLLQGVPDGLPFDCDMIWRRHNYVAVLRAQDGPGLAQWCSQVSSWLAGSYEAGWKALTVDVDWLRWRLERALEKDVLPGLEAHKGTVELVDFDGCSVRVALGGGCQGCSSATVTVGQEVSAALLRVFPQLDRVEDASAHQDPQATPHH